MAMPVNQQTANADRVIRNTGAVAPEGLSQDRPRTFHRVRLYRRTRRPATRAMTCSPAGEPYTVRSPGNSEVQVQLRNELAMVRTAPTVMSRRATERGSGTSPRSAVTVSAVGAVPAVSGVSVVLVMWSRPVRDAFAEEALWPEEEYEDQQDEDPYGRPALAAELLH